MQAQAQAQLRAPCLRGGVPAWGRRALAAPLARGGAARSRSCLHVQAKQHGGTTGNAALDSALATGKGLVESAASLVPESVPRPVAKGGVAVVGGLLAFTLLQKLVSTVLTVALLGGAAWWYFQSSSSGGGGGSSGDAGSSSGGGGGRRDDDALDDPLAEARRIMDKYKK